MELYTSFQSLLNAGDKSSELYQSPLESLADTMLFFPRAVWRERNIHIVLADSLSSDQAAKANTCRTVRFIIGSQAVINKNSINSSLWLLASALAITLLVPGLLLKEFALWTNKRANVYHQMIKVVERKVPSDADTLFLNSEINFLNSEIKSLKEKQKKCQEFQIDGFDEEDSVDGFDEEDSVKEKLDEMEWKLQFKLDETEWKLDEMKYKIESEKKAALREINQIFWANVNLFHLI